jgi:hypothetical protein
MKSPLGLLLELPAKIRCTWTDYKTRPFDKLPISGIGAEVGVYRGLHARKLLALHSKIEQLICIDPWLDFEQMTMGKAEKICRMMLSPYQSRVKICKGTLDDVTLPPLDFCYIDALHTYEAVKSDIEKVWPKIKPGGILGGHDFTEDYDGQVIQAVIEFCVKNQLRLHVGQPDWWVIKPNTPKPL